MIATPVFLRFHRTAAAALALYLAVTAAVLRCQAADVLIPVPRELVTELQYAEKVLNARHYGSAMTALETLLQADQLNAFIRSPIATDVSRRTFRSQIIDLLEALPPQGVKEYETWCGPRAMRLATNAIERGDHAELARVALDYPLTSAAGDAAFFLGCNALDHARPCEALAWFRQVAATPRVARRYEPALTLRLAAARLMLDEPSRARQTLERLGTVGSTAEFRIGDESFLADGDRDKVLAALQRSLRPAPNKKQDLSASWPIHGGNPARNATTSWAGNVGELLWRVETSKDAKADSRPGSPASLPAAHPVMTGGYVFARGPQRLTAIDLHSGRQRWEFPWGGDSAELFGSLTQQRLFHDSAYGQISSDGTRVFLLDQLRFAGHGSTRMNAVLIVNGRRIGGGPSPPVNHNRLVALSIPGEGKLCWSVGGESGEDEPKLAGAFFLGAPLPHRGVLYVLVEMDGEISFCSIDAARGRLLWQQPIVVPGQTILGDPQRRLAAAVPSFAEGVAVCTTSAGAVVAIDPFTRTVLWGYQYPATRPVTTGRRRIVINAGGARRIESDAEPRGWIDASTKICSGRVLLTPVESDELICLELDTGELLWKVRRGDGLYVAGIWKDTVLVVGTEGLSAWNLVTGKPSWDELSLSYPDKTKVSGRGILVDGFYYLPTTQQEILKIDVDQGRIVDRLAVTTQLGNLAGHGDVLVSVSAANIEAFGTTSEER